MIAELFTGERDASDVVLLIAVIVAVLAAFGHLGANALTKVAPALTAAAVGLIALALLLL